MKYLIQVFNNIDLQIQLIAGLLVFLLLFYAVLFFWWILKNKNWLMPQKPRHRTNEQVKEAELDIVKRLSM